MICGSVKVELQEILEVVTLVLGSVVEVPRVLWWCWWLCGGVAVAYVVLPMLLVQFEVGVLVWCGHIHLTISSLTISFKYVAASVSSRSHTNLRSKGTGAPQQATRSS